VKPNTKAILVTANGCCRPVLLDDIEDIYKYLGCQFFDVVRVTPDTDIFIDDAGLINQRPMNMVASLIAITKTGLPYQLVGDALIFGHDGHGESADCPKWVYAALSELNEKTSPAKKEDSDATAV
tara:strand:+ start:1064 stop:1438 length:375 start_codon:yes stop_codon:yes gene_type:complete